MRSSQDDRTARAVIRDAALRLFAERGPDRVTLRQIATEAQVSHGLVVHHFGSKEGLRVMVDSHVVELFDEMLAEATGSGGQDPFDDQGTESLVAAVVERLPAGSPVPAYLGRMLLDGTSGAGRELFARLYAVSRAALGAMADAGYAQTGADPDVRAAFLLVNDLAVLLLRDQLTAALGIDPLSREGLARWGREVLTVYGQGLQGQEQS